MAATGAIDREKSPAEREVDGFWKRTWYSAKHVPTDALYTWRLNYSRVATTINFYQDVTLPQCMSAFYPMPCQQVCVDLGEFWPFFSSKVQPNWISACRFLGPGLWRGPRGRRHGMDGRGPRGKQRGVIGLWTSAERGVSEMTLQPREMDEGHRNRKLTLVITRGIWWRSGPPGGSTAGAVSHERSPFHDQFKQWIPMQWVLHRSLQWNLQLLVDLGSFDLHSHW